MSRLKSYLLMVVCACQVLTVVAQNKSEQDTRRYDYYNLESVRMRNLGKYVESYELLNHALSIKPDSPAALFDMANYSSFLNSKNTALAYYEKAVALDPHNYWYQQVLGTSYYRNNQLDKAIAVYEKMAQNQSDKADVFYNLLSLYTQKQDYAKCIWTLDKIESLDGKSEQISLEKYRMYLRLDQKEKAFNEIESLSKEYANDSRYRIILGDLYLSEGDSQNALKVFRQVLKEEPDNVTAQLSLISYYEKENQLAEAKKALEALALNPSSDAKTRSTVMRKIIQQSEKLHEDSTRVLTLFDKIMQLPQETPEVALLCAQYKVMKKMPEEEIGNALRVVVKIDPSNVAARLQLMQYAFNKEDFADAIQLCQEAIEYAPDEVPFYYYMGLAYYQGKHLEQAIAVLVKGISNITPETDKELASDMFGVLGDIYHEKKMEKRAYEVYDSALVYKPDNVQVLNNYAYYLALEKKNLEKAEAMSFKTIKADPKAYNELDTYAWILFLEKKYTEAKIYIEQSLKNGGEAHSGIVEHAGDIFSQLGDLTRAMEYWQKADQLGSESKTLKRKIKQKKYIGE